MKKVLTSILIVLLIFNFIVCNYAVYAEEESRSQLQTTYEQEIDQNSLSENDENIGNGESAQNYGSSFVGTVIGGITRAIDYIVLQVDALISQLAYTENNSADEVSNSTFWFTIDKTVFNKVALFNINYFNTESSYTVGDDTITADDNNIAIKESVTTVYYICRILAVAISLLVLIYIGIRMAISTIASEQAKYKKMLVGWIESILILFLMPYIMSALFTFSDMLINVFYNIRNSLLQNDTTGMYGVFENTVRTKIFGRIHRDAGLRLAMWSIVYWFLLFNELKFLWLYLKRILMVGFLIMISPIITVTYSIDKAGDGKAQAFNIWLKEFIVNVLIQPLHAIIYLIFIFSANAIATSSPLVGVALLYAMGQAERMVKIIFDMKGSSLKSVNKFLKKEG